MNQHKVLTLLGALKFIDRHWSIDSVGILDEANKKTCAPAIIINQRKETLTNFYAQLFTPELITELFEGWENVQMPDEHPDFLNANSEGIVFGITGYSIVSIVSENEEEYVYPEQPANLADFISDCKRSALVLYWKEDVVKEHPYLKNN